MIQTIENIELKPKERILSAKPYATGAFQARGGSRQMQRAYSTFDRPMLTTDPTTAQISNKTKLAGQHYSGALTTANSAYTGQAQHRFLKNYHKELESVIPGPSCYNTII